MENVSKVHARNLVAWAKTKPQVVVLSADLTDPPRSLNSSRLIPSDSSQWALQSRT